MIVKLALGSVGMVVGAYGLALLSCIAYALYVRQRLRRYGIT